MENAQEMPGQWTDNATDLHMLWADQEEIEAIRAKRRARAGVPPRFRQASLGNWTATGDLQRDVLDVARWYIENFLDLRRSGSGVVFCGSVGTGKTHLACAIINELLDRGIAALFVKFPVLVSRIRATYGGREGPTRQDLLDELLDADLLVLDEIGLRKGAADEQALLDEIVDGRYDQVRPTIVCSNLSRDALLEAVGERTFDRLTDKKGALMVFDWPSWRQG